MSRPPRIVERIEAAVNLANAAGAQITVAIAKRAKSLGCDAFKAGNRIDWQELKDWCAANTDSLKVDGDNLELKDQKLNEEVRKLRRLNDIAEEKLIPVLTHEGEIRAMANAVQGVLLAMPSRLAPDLAGNTIPVIESKMKAAVYEAIGKLSRGESQ